MPCDGMSLQNQPYLCPDRGSIGFAREFMSGTFVGTRPQETLILSNGSVKDLEISSVSYGGNAAFSFKTSPETLPATIAGNKAMLVQIIFAPTQPGLHRGTLTVQSNASNSPSSTFEITGCGVSPDAGIPAECRVDAGTQMP